MLRNDLYFLLRYGLNREFVEERDWWFDRCREVQAEPDGYIDLWSREHGKAIDCEEPTLTSLGWKKHRDIIVGDYVFSPSGMPVKVLAVTETWTDRECYKINFDNDYSVVASDNHLWRLQKKSKRRIKGTNKRHTHDSHIVKTSDLFLHNHEPDNRYSVPINEKLEFTKSDLIIDPYVLGCWLGDGATSGAKFVFSNDDSVHFADEFQKLGHTVTYFGNRATVKQFTLDVRDKNICVRGHDKSIVGTYRNQCVQCRKNGHKDTVVADGLAWRLRKLGLLRDESKCNSGNRKHVPDQYIFAGSEQRRSLLQGLMDTDGTVNPRGTAYFVNTNKEIADAVFYLSASLGMKPSQKTKIKKYKGEDYVVYNVSFQAYKNDNPFRLLRKLNRCKDGKRQNSRQILSVERTKSIPVSCLQVEGGMYLVGKHLVPTHNSTILTVSLTIQDILRNPEITVGIFSHTRPIAKSFMRVIKREFETNEKLKQLFPDILWSDPHKESPKWSEDEGIVVKRKGNPPESTVEACGLVDGMPTGRHYELRVYDDVVTSDSVTTVDQMQKTVDAMDMSSNLGKIGGKVRIIGTRYKLGDAYEEYMKRGKYKARVKPATDNGRVDGKPVMLTQEEWENKLLDMSPAIISSQMLQNPLASDSVIFQPDWFNLWPAEKQLPEFDAVYQSFDGATSQRETADYSCLTTWGVFKAREGDVRHSVMMLDCFMERVSYPEMRDEIIRQMQNKFGANDCPVSAIIIEDKSSGSALIPEFRRSGITVISYNPGKLDKIARANLVSHLVRDGVIWLPESRNAKRKGYPMSWLSAWHEQMLYFPNVKHDDGVDSAVQFLSVMDKMGLIRGKKLPEREQSYWRRQMKQSPYG